MEKTFLLLVALLPMCSLFFQQTIKEPLFGLCTFPGSITKIQPTAEVKPNQL